MFLSPSLTRRGQSAAAAALAAAEHIGTPPRSRRRNGNPRRNRSRSRGGGGLGGGGGRRRLMEDELDLIVTSPTSEEQRSLGLNNNDGFEEGPMPLSNAVGPSKENQMECDVCNPGPLPLSFEMGWWESFTFNVFALISRLSPTVTHPLPLASTPFISSQQPSSDNYQQAEEEEEASGFSLPRPFRSRPPPAAVTQKVRGDKWTCSGERRETGRETRKERREGEEQGLNKKIGLRAEGLEME